MSTRTYEKTSEEAKPYEDLRERNAKPVPKPKPKAPAPKTKE
jgi:hypothetical protein